MSDSFALGRLGVFEYTREMYVPTSCASGLFPSI